MSMKHTPGPWGADGHYVFDAKGNCIAITDTDNAPLTVMAANARLIATAPDLLVALKAFMAAKSIPPQAVFDAARAAIAKATGEA